jgi:C-terminal processing protease CtpA/Prc
MTRSVALALTASTVPGSGLAAERLIPAAALRADLDLAYSALKEGSPALYRFTTKASVDRAFADARSKLDRPMSALDFYRHLAVAIATLRNGHTTLSATDEDWAAISAQRLLPLGVRVIDRRAYVFRDFSGARHSLAGREVLAINGRSMRDLLALFDRSSSLDGIVPSARDRNDSGWGLIYNLALLAGAQAPYTVKLSGRAEPRTVRLDGLTVAEIKDAWKAFPADRESGAARKATLTFADRVAVLRIPHWDHVEDGQRSMIDDVADWAAALDRRKPAALIVDVRANGGGDETVATALFQRLMPRPFTHYSCIGINARDFSFLRSAKDADEYRRNLVDYTMPAPPSCRWLAPFELIKRPNIGVQQPVSPGFAGKLIVLTDGGSFSTSAEFAALVRTHRRGLIVGEETSGSYYGSNSGIMIPLLLPNSKVELSVPTISYWLNVRNGIARDRGVPADRPVRETIADMISGRDRVMAEAMRLAWQR